MSHDRSTAILLPASEPRCEHTECTVRGRCARYQAVIGRANVADFSKAHGYGSAICDAFIRSSYFTRGRNG